jgi:CDP-ribitol ribitolphosphotransferase
VLDSYCIPVSLLRHKKELTVVQMWHAIGLLKKAGYSILDKEEGRGSSLADLMHMHENYDIVLAGSEACRKPMSEVFGCPPDRIRIHPLPRVDALMSAAYAERKRSEIRERYPELSAKQTILYVPTMRGDEGELQKKLDELIGAVDYDRYHLIVKPHPLSRLKVSGGKALTCDGFSSEELLFAADCVVSDYSGMVFEALAAGKKEYFYAFDYDDYAKKRGWFIDYREEIPGDLLHTGAEVAAAIDAGEFDAAAGWAFFDAYVDPPRGASYTADIAGLLMDLLHSPGD